jgi:peptidoglycan/LPS O-acetylase OafA/YrhL
MPMTSIKNDARAAARAEIRRDSAPGSNADGRIPELDALRGAAALAVVVFHADARWFRWGWSAVDLFFVLSGYLITAIILRHGSRPGFLASFYARRALRIWPLYFLAVGLVAAASPWLAHPPDWAALPYTLTFTQGVPEYWTGNAAAGFSRYLGHTWTLAVEEQFYLIWPALLLAVGRARVIPLALGVAAVSVAARCSGWNSVLLLARADGLALGALLAGLELRAGDDPARRRSLGVASLASLAVGAVAVWSLGGFTYLQQVARRGPTFLAYNLMYLGAVGAAVSWSRRPALAWLRRRRWVWLGTVSYGLYLFHQILFHILGDVLKAHDVAGRPAWLFIPAILVSVGLAALSYRWIETPILRLKSRFPYAGEVRANAPRPASGRPGFSGRFDLASAARTGWR